MLKSSRDTKKRHEPWWGEKERKAYCVTPDLTYDYGREREKVRAKIINGMEWKKIVVYICEEDPPVRLDIDGISLS